MDGEQVNMSSLFVTCSKDRTGLTDHIQGPELVLQWS